MLEILHEALVSDVGSLRKYKKKFRRFRVKILKLSDSLFIKEVLGTL